MSTRITDIRKATVNGVKVKLFNAWRFSPVDSGYVFEGQFAVPQRTANKAIPDLYAAENPLRASHDPR